MSPRPPLRSLALALAVTTLGAGLAACAHQGAPAPSGPSRALLGQASQIGRIA